MKRSLAYKVRVGLVLVAGAFSMNCGGCGSAGSTEVFPRSFAFLNAANGVPTSRAIIREDGGPEQHTVAQNIAFGTLSPRLTVPRDNSRMTATIEGGSGAFSAVSESRFVGAFNLIASTQLANNVDFVDMFAIDPETDAVRVGFVHDWNTHLDAYITAPGASIAALDPDARNIEPGHIAVAAKGSLHPNTVYQVRMCEQGTKTVVFDTGTLGGTPAETVHVIMAVRSGTEKLTRQFVVDLR